MTDRSAPVIAAREDGVLILTLNRPQVRNALSWDMLDALVRHLGTAAGDPGIAVVLLTGAGGHFCSGADLSTLRGAAAGDPAADRLADVESRLLRYTTLISTLRTLPQIVVARVEGHAVGAGLSLALAADFVVAADSAQLQLAFSRLGLVPDLGATHFLPRLVGPVRARALALLDEPLTGAEAAALGLIFRAVPASDLDETVRELTRSLLRLPGQARALTKAGLEASEGRTLEDSLVWEMRTQARLLRSDETRQAIAAFLSRRSKP